MLVTYYATCCLQALKQAICISCLIHCPINCQKNISAYIQDIVWANISSKSYTILKRGHRIRNLEPGISMANFIQFISNRSAAAFPHLLLYCSMHCCIKANRIVNAGRVFFSCPVRQHRAWQIATAKCIGCLLVRPDGVNREIMTNISPRPKHSQYIYMFGDAHS